MSEPTEPKTRRKLSEIAWEAYQGESFNPEWSGYSAGHYHTGHPGLGWCLYSGGDGGCWNQRTKTILPPEPHAKPVRLDGKWWWTMDAPSVSMEPKSDSASGGSSPSPATPPQNTLAPCPQEWKLTLLEGQFVVNLGEGNAPVWFNRHGNENRKQLEALISAHNASRAPCPIKDEGEALRKLCDAVGEYRRKLRPGLHLRDEYQDLADAHDVAKAALGKPEASTATTGTGPMEFSNLLNLIEQRAIDPRVPKGPWVTDHDSAGECGPHAHSGLAMVLAPQDDSKLPWPPARLLEWPTAEFIAAARSDVPALVKALRRALAFIDGMTNFNANDVRWLRDNAQRDIARLLSDSASPASTQGETEKKF